MTTPDGRMRAYYEQGKEQARLVGPKGTLESERTKEILLRRLPAAPAVVADIGGGPGHYAQWLSGLGYTVRHRDLMELHVDQLRSLGDASIDTAVGDARQLDLPDASVDAVLLCGPLYHLTSREDRLQALREARRIVRDGGPVFVAVISRWAPRLDGVVQERLYEGNPDFLDALPDIEATGVLPPVVPDGFVGYTHRPDDLVAEVSEAGLFLEDLVGVEGMPLAAVDMESRVSDPVAWNVLLDAARAFERVPELRGLSPHLVATLSSTGGASTVPAESERQVFDVETRVEAPLHGDEVAVLRGSLTYQRDTLRWKCSGLTREQLTQALPPTDMTLGGIMKHLALVESQWFDHHFRDLGFAPPFDTLDWDAEGDWDFESARDDSPAQLRALFDGAVRRSDAVVDDALARGGLDEESVRTSPVTGGTFTLRWILVHLIEEYARHNGHADLIRQSIDGRTG